MKKRPHIPVNENVQEVLNLYEQPVIDRLLEIRGLIFETAEKTLGPDQVEETLKWAQPSYVTTQPRTGSTIRIDKKAKSNMVSVYFVCTSHLIDSFQEIYPDLFAYRDGRAIDFDLDSPIPQEEFSHCIALALTYHLRKRNNGAIPQLQKAG